MDIKGIHGAYKFHSHSLQNRPSQKVDGVSAAQNQTSQDTIQISSQASFQSKMDTAMEKVAADKQFSQSSSAKIAALKIKYQGDSCSVSGDAIARAILNKVCGDKGQEGEN